MFYRLKMGFLRTVLLLGMLLMSLSLNGCGSSSGDGGGESAIKKGVFVDSVVIGLSYKTPSTSGLTDGNGTFEYRDGERIQFFIGDIFIGETSGKGIITPVDLVPGASDETHPQVINLIRFLQTLDEDQNLDNGILLVALVRDVSMGRSVDFTLSVSDFELDSDIQLVIADLTQVLGSVRNLVTSLSAQAHFRGSLLGLFKGFYRGTFSGDASGTWEFMVSSQGLITGTSIADDGGSEILSGSIGSNGQASVSGTAGSGTFTGIFQPDGNVTGTWQDLVEGESGTFTGNRVASSGEDDEVETDPSVLGSLGLSGSDTSAIGTSFTPNKPTLVNIDTSGGSVIWNYDDIGVDILKGKGIAIALGFLEDGTVTGLGIGVGTVEVVSGATIAKTYGYALLCSEIGADCSGISVDIAEKKATFSNASIPKIDTAESSSATGPIQLDGVLTW